MQSERNPVDEKVLHGRPTYVDDLNGISPADINTRPNIPDIPSTNRRSEHRTSEQQTSDSAITLGVLNGSPYHASNNVLDPDEIHHFLAQIVMGDAFGIRSLGTPQEIASNEASSILSRFLTVRRSDEPLVHEAQQAIKAGRIFEGQDMLRKRQEERRREVRRQGHRLLSSDSSEDIQVTTTTQSNTTHCTECEERRRVVTAETEFQRRNL